MAEEVSLVETILVTVVLREAKEKVSGGGAPVFFAENKEEQEKLSLILSRILKGMVHDLENGVYIITKH